MDHKSIWLYFYLALLLTVGCALAQIFNDGKPVELPFYRNPNMLRRAPTPYFGRVQTFGDRTSARHRAAIGDSLDAGHLRNFVQQPHLDQDTGDDCTPFPNGTRYRPFINSCADGSELLAVHDAAVTNSTGDDHYPVDFSGTVRFFLDITSYADRRLEDVSAEVSLYKRSTGWFGCGWLFIPSFGLLSNYRLCDGNPSCPIVPGRQVLEVAIDPSLLFTGLFQMIHDDQTVYQLVLRIRNNQQPHERLLCASVQTRIQL